MNRILTGHEQTIAWLVEVVCELDKRLKKLEKKK